MAHGGASYANSVVVILGRWESERPSVAEAARIREYTYIKCIRIETSTGRNNGSGDGLVTRSP